MFLSRKGSVCKGRGVTLQLLRVHLPRVTCSAWPKHPWVCPPTGLPGRLPDKMRGRPRVKGLLQRLRSLGGRAVVSLA